MDLVPACFEVTAEAILSAMEEVGAFELGAEFRPNHTFRGLTIKGASELEFSVIDAHLRSRAALLGLGLPPRKHRDARAADPADWCPVALRAVFEAWYGWHMRDWAGPGSRGHGQIVLQTEGRICRFESLRFPFWMLFTKDGEAPVTPFNQGSSRTETLCVP
jgi:hypothetical protein